jgi:catechol 2,3-dioxygenase-like lactoylglutathione lyase family enzyme
MGPAERGRNEVSLAILSLDHVSILSASPQHVADFYRDFLGFDEARIREAPGLRIFDLFKGSDHIEILQTTDGRDPGSGGLKHVAFRSDDIQADFERFRAQGARMLHQEVQHSEGCDFFFVRSPGGEWVEILQYHKEDQKS